MTDRPIIFSASMVRGIVEGRKTQTRRIIKPQPEWERPEPCCSTTSEGWQGPIDRATWAESADPEMDFRRSPYGGPGDRLYVRENFRLPAACDAVKPSDMSFPARIRYEADPPHPEGDPKHGGWGKLRPAIHLPRQASRLNLTLAAVRVERLNDISEADALAEGVEHRKVDTGYPGAPLQDAYFVRGGHDEGYTSAIAAFRGLWDRINGKSYPWATNPWVWVLDFGGGNG